MFTIEQADWRESWLALGHILGFHVDMTYTSTIIAKGTMLYPLWAPVDAVDQAGPTV